MHRNDKKGTMSEEVERLRQRAIYKLTMRYGKPFVRFNMAPKHTTNALIPKPVQALTIKIKESNDLPTIQRLAKAAEDIFDRRIDPNAIMPILNAAVKKDNKGSVSMLDTILEYQSDTSSSDEEETKSSSDDEEQSDMRTKDELVRENKALSKKVNKLRQTNSDAVRALMEQHNALEESDIETNALNEQVEALEKANEMLRGQVKTLTKDKNLNKIKDKTLFKQSADNKTVIETLRTEIFKLTKQNEKLETENKEYKENIGLLNKDLNSLKKFYGSRDSPVSSRPEDTFVEKGSADLQNELYEKQNEIDKLSQERKDCDETKDALNKAVEFAEKLDQSDKVIIEEKEKEIKRLDAKNEELENNNAILREELDNIWDQKNRQLEQKFSVEINRVKTQLTEQLLRNQDLQNELNALKQQQGISAQRRGVILSQTEDEDAVFAASVAEGLIPALPTIRFPERHEI